MSHAETLYALKRQARGPVESRIEYRMAPTIGEIWEAVAEEKGVSVANLRAAGWRAIKVVVQEV